MHRRGFVRATGLAAGLGAVPGSVRGQSADALHEAVTVTYDGSTDRFRFEYAYDVPDAITELTVRIGALGRTHLSVLETTSLERDGDGGFVWDGGSDPKIVLAHDVFGDAFADGAAGYSSDGVGFSYVPNTGLPFRYRGSLPERTHSITIDGEGHAGDGFVYAGPHDLTTREVGGTAIELVVPATVERAIDREAVFDPYAFGERHLDARLDHDAVTLFVVPGDHIGSRTVGLTVKSSVMLDEAVVDVRSIESIPPHEYGHVLYGTFGDGEMAWLQEGAAEYLGNLLALNVGYGTFEAFLEAVRTETYADAVLSTPAEFARTKADYEKGAHVLAALDAEIRERSSTQHTVLDVLTREGYDLRTYGDFVAAAVEVAGDESLQQWLDRYVRSDALPDVPAERRYYVLGDNEPETLPTATPTPTPTATPVATPSPTPTATSSAPKTQRSRSDVTETDAPGFGIATVVLGIAGALGLLQR